MSTLRVGATLYGYCGGLLGRDFYGPARVEAIGADWVVMRREAPVGVVSRNGAVFMYEGCPEDLVEYTKDPEGRTPCG